MLPPRITKYLSSRAICGPWTLSGAADCGDFSGAVVIPALAESPNLFATLRSLAENPPELLSRFLVLVVVNHREDAPEEDKADNRKALMLLEQGDPAVSRLRLAWVDAASPGLELPRKKGGVGLARKIGFDLALPLLDYRHDEPVLAALDADTLAQPDYLPALVRHFRAAKEGGAVIDFRHREGETAVEREAIGKYELFLRGYVLGLSVAASPYAFHTIGSAMACTASAYAGIGGMNTRAAAEDFYFLQQLKKTAGVSLVAGTTVHPSARASHRVPFGTGRSVSRLVTGDEAPVLFYRPECFMILRQWLSLVGQRPEAGGEYVRSEAEAISPDLGGYLDEVRFSEAWDNLRRNSRDRYALLTAFHSWFDGLRTLKLIHHLSAGPLPRGRLDDLIPPLLEWAGLKAKDDREGQLSLLRSIQAEAPA